MSIRASCWWNRLKPRLGARAGTAAIETALLAPIGLSLAKNLGVNPQAVLMAITVAASCAFATPVGTPPNTLVLGPGQYRFIDFVKVGTGLVLVCFVVSLLVIPWVWPLAVNGIGIGR